MLLIAYIQASVSWFLGQIGKVDIHLERMSLEFIFLGRIPGTEFYLQFEVIAAALIGVAFVLVLRMILRDPYARYSK